MNDSNGRARKTLEFAFHRQGECSPFSTSFLQNENWTILNRDMTKKLKRLETHQAWSQKKRGGGFRVEEFTVALLIRCTLGK